MSEHWLVDAEKTQDHWLGVRDPEGWWSASVKWDGCIHLQNHRVSMDDPNHKPAEADYLHICDLDDVITRLQALKAMALEHFKGDWPG